ncbi:MAG TPA: amidohydrolase family protein, partial [Candidatus Thermoplasmatota archaeon]|nr:amidohydrolase family protein [Candidatus Thermoplasmatota archaeon]
MIDSQPVFDAHLHVQPIDRFRPAVRDLVLGAMRPEAHEIVARGQKDPAVLLAFLDAEGVDRAVLVNYVAPDVTGTDESVNAWVVAYAKAAPDRLVPMGGVHPGRVDGPEAARAAVDAVLAKGIRAFKLHPSHQLVDPLAYLEETPLGRALAAVYRRL